jgi:hypothetical protein
VNEGGHWYHPITGDACHTIIGKNGKERSTTLRDAKQEGYLPSVTTITKTLASPELDRWKQQQVLMASLTLPRLPEESDEDYCKRIMEDAFKQVDDAADLGTRIHAAIEAHFQGYAYDPELKLYVETVERWANENGVTFLEHEVRLVNREVGYAGTTDAKIQVKGREGFGTLDFKSRKSRPQYPMKPWSKEPMQIAAYRACHGTDYGVNVFVSTTEPGRIEEAWYEPEELDRQYEAFKHVVAIWQHLNNFNLEEVLAKHEAVLDF